MKKKIYVDTSQSPLLDQKPPREERPVCLNCGKLIGIRSSRWYGDFHILWEQRPVKWIYDGETFFCRRNCALNYAWKAANKELNISDFNNVK